MAMKRYRRSIFDEIEEMRQRMDEMFGQMVTDTRLALPGPRAGRWLTPLGSQDFRVDVLEHDNEVIVTVDLMPGVGKEDISLGLPNPRALEISVEKKTEEEKEAENYYLRERSYGAARRIVPLPADVTIEGAKASFRNGVLEVHLKKTGKEAGKKISIE
jgi:HSP20 family protein